MSIKFYGGTSGGAYTLPDQTGKSGQVLTTTGTTAGWAIDKGWNLIQTLQSSSTNAFAFTDIPQMFRDLRLTCIWKNDNVNSYNYIRFNGLETNYRDNSWSTDGPSGNNYRNNTDAWYIYPYPNVYRGTYELIFPDYTSTVHDKSFYGRSNTGDYNKNNLHGGTNYNAERLKPITRLTGYANNFSNGNYTWNLYGSL
jgi:hypothetical protein